MRRKKFSLKEVIIIVVLVSFFMFFLGGLSMYMNLGGINYSLLGNDNDLQNFISSYENLINNYYTNINRQDIISGAINGMYSKIDDPYTTYLDIENANNLNDSLNGIYTGIGIRIEDEGEITRIVEVFDNSPALIAGLKPGDIITSINGEDVSGLYGLDISSKIRNSNNTITIGIKRDGIDLFFTLNSKDILLPSVSKELLSWKGHTIGYIAIDVFNDTADIQFESALSSLEKDNIESLILDLRNNLGGYLEVAKNIAEMFLEKGKNIYSLKYKDEELVFNDITNEERKYRIVVLVNEKTASASEILAASLKYSYGATLIGTKTYGKGKVQEKKDLSNGASIKYTTALWVTPNGDCIDGIGLIPDYEVDLDIDTLNNDDIYSDSQILYALNSLVD